MNLKLVFWEKVAEKQHFNELRSFFILQPLTNRECHSNIFNTSANGAKAPDAKPQTRPASPRVAGLHSSRIIASAQAIQPPTQTTRFSAAMLSEFRLLLFNKLIDVLD